MQLLKRHLLAVLLIMIAALSLALVACGDDDGDGDGEEPTATAGGETPTDGDGLSDIPEDTTGVTDTEIKVGTHLPLTGVAGIYGNAIAPSMQAYFSYINDTEGGVNGRKITLLIEDDAYEPPQTNTVVRKLVEQDGVFAMVSGLGTATHASVFEYLAQNNIPDMFVSTGATMFTDPITRTAFGFNPNYVQEGTAIGTYIAENFPEGTTVGMLIQNDDFGKDGETGVRAGLEGSGIEVTTVITYEAAQTDMTSQVQNLQNAGVDVVVGYVLPRQAGSLATVARDQLSWDADIIVSGVVADQLTIALMGAANAEGIITAAYLKPLETEGDEGIELHKQIMAQYAPDVPPSNVSVYAHALAETFVEALKGAGDNVNRRSLVQSAESLTDFVCSVCLGPINLSPTDHRPIETFQFASVVNGVWVPFGDLISYESTP